MLQARLYWPCPWMVMVSLLYRPRPPKTYTSNQEKSIAQSVKVWDMMLNNIYLCMLYKRHIIIYVYLTKVKGFILSKKKKKKFKSLIFGILLHNVYMDKYVQNICQTCSKIR